MAWGLGNTEPLELFPIWERCLSGQLKFPGVAEQGQLLASNCTPSDGRWKVGDLGAYLLNGPVQEGLLPGEQP